MRTLTLHRAHTSIATWLIAITMLVIEIACSARAAGAADVRAWVTETRRGPWCVRQDNRPLPNRVRRSTRRGLFRRNGHAVQSKARWC